MFKDRQPKKSEVIGASVLLIGSVLLSACEQGSSTERPSASVTVSSYPPFSMQNVFKDFHDQDNLYIGGNDHPEIYKDGKLVVDWSSGALQRAISFNLACEGTTLVVERPGFDQFKTVAWRSPNDAACIDHIVSEPDKVFERADLMIPSFDY